MKVRCIINKIFAIKNKNLMEKIKQYYKNELGDCLEDPNYLIPWLEIGKEYMVYGITIEDGIPFYYLCPDSDYTYPLKYCSTFYEVIDPRLSQYWIWNHKILEDRDNIEIVFVEWAKDDMFHEEVVDGEEEYVSTFLKYKNLMDLEFYDQDEDPKFDNLKEPGVLSDNWVMCPECTDSWEVEVNQRGTECPSCKKLFHNPYYLPKKNY